MQSFTQFAPFTRQDIIDALHGVTGSRELTFRYDLLDKQDRKIRELESVVEGEVEMSALATIKRTAKFTIKDDGGIDYLQDRIQPWAILRMPAKKASRIEYRALYNRNLFVANTRVMGYPNSDTGEIIMDPISFTSDFIPVEGATKLTWSTGGRNRYKQLVFFDENFAYMPPDAFNSDAAVHSVTADVPAGAAYVRASSDDYADGFFKLEVGSTATEWSPSVEDVVMPTYQAEWMEKVVVDESQPSTSIELPLGVFLLSSPTQQDEGGAVFREVDAYDGLLVLRDDKFESRYFIAAGTNYRDAVIAILASAGITKHNIEQTEKVLPNDKEFPPGKEKLYAINELLGAINFTTVTHDVYGYYTSQYYRSPSTRAAEYTYKDDELSIMIPGMSEEMDTFSVPNRWVAVLTDPEMEPISSTYTNDSPDSPFSTVNRGRIIVDYREVEDIADQEALDAYVQRIAFNASQIYGKLEFATAINPFHDLNDVVEIDYSPLGIIGKYAETEWRIPLRAGAEMEHAFRRVVNI